MFRQLGATIIDSDLIAHEVAAQGGSAYNDIIKRFGREILNADGEINREELGAIVFNNEAARKDLNAITHPKVFELMTKKIREAEEGGADVVMVDIPLLFEAGAQTWIKTVILVYADPETQLRRLIARDNCDEARAMARISSQLPIEEKKKLASIVIVNTGPIENTRHQVLEVWEQIKYRL
jgi:dephospho-CoA kinase